MRIGAITATIVACVCATLPPAGAATSPNGRPVYIYGDSVLLGAVPQIDQRLSEEGWRPEIRAWVGMNMAAAIELIGNERHLHGDVVVLGIGNNYFGNPDAFRQQIDEVMAILSGVTRVIWLNVREFQPDRADANRELALALARWPNLEIADWNSLSVSQPNTFWSDGLHLRPEGAALMAQLIRDRLEAFLLGAPRSTVPVTGVAIQPVTPEVYGFTSQAEAVNLPAPNDVSLSPFVGIASSASGQGYWLATSDGNVTEVGDARDLGSLVDVALNQPIVGMEATPSHKGFWLVARDGGVFSFGDAVFYGSTGAITLNQPIVGIEPSPTGAGYWIVASDGGVFSFGDAKFHGSTGNLRLNQPVVNMAATPSGNGYWLVAFDGGVFSFGDAKFLGSKGGEFTFWPWTDILTRNQVGYLIIDQGGDVVPFGFALASGTRKDVVLEDRFFAIAPRPDGGYWLAAQRAA